MNLQAVASRIQLPYLIGTLMKNPWREELGTTGLDLANRKGFFRGGGKQLVLDRPYIASGLNNQFANGIIKDSVTILRSISGISAWGCLQNWSSKIVIRHTITCCWYRRALSLWTSTILILWYCAEMPPQSDPELRELVRKLHNHPISPYCRGITSNSRCWLVNASMKVTQLVYKIPTCNWGV